MPKTLVVLVALLIIFASSEWAFAYDVCSDDISGPGGNPDESSCVHEDMAQYGAIVYEANLFPGNQGLFRLTGGVRRGAGHEDEKDHVYGETGNTLTIGHFWDPDPFGLFFNPDNESLLDGGAIFQGLTPNGWQKSQAYWSRSLAEYAYQNFSDSTGAYHYLGHVVHHMGDNTIPTHAHVTSHGPGNRDSFENWMSNKFHYGFPLNEGGDYRSEYSPSDWNHLLLQSELTALTVNHQPLLGRIDPLKYADLDFDIPEVGGLERPDMKLLWLMYTTNQIAEFFAADRDDGQALDPTGWVRADLLKMSNPLLGLRPRTEEQIDPADSADGSGQNPDVGGILSEIRKYSHLRGIRAIGGLYHTYEQTVNRKPILTIEIHSVDVVGGSNGNCNDGLIGDLCDFYSRVSFSPVYPVAGDLRLYGVAVIGQNEGEQVFDDNSIDPDYWRWGHAVENSGFAQIKLQILDEEDFPYPEDVPVRIAPIFADDNDGGKILVLEVDLAKCMRGESGALNVKSQFSVLPDPSTLSQINGDVCNQAISTRVTGDEDENDGIARVSFTVKVSEFASPEVACATTDDVWHANNVTIPCIASDPGIGLANAADAQFVLSTTASAGTETASATTSTQYICDLFSNCSLAGPVPGYKIDMKAPTVTAPADRSVEATAVLTQFNFGQAMASDLGSGVADISSDADPLGFPVGTTVVTWTAIDNVGNTATATQQVVVSDTTPPVVTVPPDTSVEGYTFVNNFDQATATDAVGVVEIKSNPGIYYFPTGENVVTWTAIDAAGNVGTATQRVTATKSGGGAFGYAGE